MAIREIRTTGDPILNKVSKEIKEITPNIIQLLDDMNDTMQAANGAGIAAVQIGALRRAILVVSSEDTILELINPVLIESKDENIDTEGCLSVPGQTGEVARPLYVKVEGLDRYGKKVVYEATDRVAVAFCHELDHLDGILYTDKLV